MSVQYIDNYTYRCVCRPLLSSFLHVLEHDVLRNGYGVPFEALPVQPLDAYPLFTLETVYHSVSVLEIRPARALERPFGLVYTSAMFITVEFFRKSDSTYPTQVLLLFDMNTSHMFE